MAEVDRLTFSYPELTEILIKNSDVHEGLWYVYLEFGLAGANVGTSPEKGDLLPAAIVPVVKIGIQRTTEISSLTVDASKVNPVSRKKN